MTEHSAWDLAMVRDDPAGALDEIAQLREALAAYRSALRSGERESEQLRKLSDAAFGRGAA